MASTFKGVAETMEDMNITTYVVKSRGGALLGYNYDKKQDVDTSIGRLKKLLMEQTGDIVKVELGKTEQSGGDTSKIIRMDVELNSLRSDAAPVAGHSSINNELVERQAAEILNLKEQLIELKYQRQIDELRAEISGAAEDNDPIGKIADMLAPVISAYLPQLLGQGVKTTPPPINGMPPFSETNELLTRWHNQDNNFIEVLEAIVLLSENNKPVYNNYRPVIIETAQ